MVLKKALALLTAICFLQTSVIAPGWAQTTKPSGKMKEALDGLMLPSSVARITNGHCFGTGCTVINIQDLHCHPEVQRNITRTLEILNDQYRVKGILVEGAYGGVDTSWLEKLPDQKLKQEIADAMLNDGRLTGAEYYSAMQGKPTALIGLEDEQLHKQNIARLGIMLEHQKRYEEKTKELKKDLAYLQAKYFNDRNRKFDEIIDDYRAGRITPRKFYLLLGKYVDKINSNPDSFTPLFSISMDKYPNTKTYFSILADEKHLNYGRVSRQMKEFMVLLKKKLPPAAYNLLLEKTGDLGKTDMLYLCLERMTKEFNLDLSTGFPELKRFFDYMEKGRHVNPTQLAKEENQLIEEIRTGLCQDVAEVEVSFLTDFFSFFEDYLNNRLSADNYAYFVQRFGRFREIWARYDTRNSMADLAGDFEMLNTYYKTNETRNDYFIRNITAALPAADAIVSAAPVSAAASVTESIDATVGRLKETKDIVIVITGGFHTEVLENLLAEKKLSYLTVTPNITQSTAKANAVYMSLARHQARILANALQVTIASEQSSSELLPMIAGALWRRAGLDQDQIKKALGQLGYTNISVAALDEGQIKLTFTDQEKKEQTITVGKGTKYEELSDADATANIKTWLEQSGDAAVAATGTVLEVLRKQTTGALSDILFPEKLLLSIAAYLSENNLIVGNGLIYALEKNPEFLALGELTKEELRNMPEWLQELAAAQAMETQALRTYLRENSSAVIHALYAVDIIRRSGVLPRAAGTQANTGETAEEETTAAPVLRKSDGKNTISIRLPLKNDEFTVNEVLAVNRLSQKRKDKFNQLVTARNDLTAKMAKLKGPDSRKKYREYLAAQMEIDRQYIEFIEAISPIKPGKDLLVDQTGNNTYEVTAVRMDMQSNINADTLKFTLTLQGDLDTDTSALTLSLKKPAVEEQSAAASGIQGITTEDVRTMNMLPKAAKDKFKKLVAEQDSLNATMAKMTELKEKGIPVDEQKYAVYRKEEAGLARQIADILNGITPFPPGTRLLDQQSRAYTVKEVVLKDKTGIENDVLAFRLILDEVSPIEAAKLVLHQQKEAGKVSARNRTAASPRRKFAPRGRIGNNDNTIEPPQETEKTTPVTSVKIQFPGRPGAKEISETSEKKTAVTENLISKARGTQTAKSGTPKDVIQDKKNPQRQESPSTKAVKAAEKDNQQTRQAQNTGDNSTRTKTLHSIASVPDILPTSKPMDKEEMTRAVKEEAARLQINASKEALLGMIDNHAYENDSYSDHDRTPEATFDKIKEAMTFLIKALRQDKYDGFTRVYLGRHGDLLYRIQDAIEKRQGKKGTGNIHIDIDETEYPALHNLTKLLKDNALKGKLIDHNKFYQLLSDFYTDDYLQSSKDYDNDLAEKLLKLKEAKETVQEIHALKDRLLALGIGDSNKLLFLDMETGLFGDLPLLLPAIVRLFHDDFAAGRKNGQVHFAVMESDPTLKLNENIELDYGNRDEKDSGYKELKKAAIKTVKFSLHDASADHPDDLLKYYFEQLILRNAVIENIRPNSDRAKASTAKPDEKETHKDKTQDTAGKENSPASEAPVFNEKAQRHRLAYKSDDFVYGESVHNTLSAATRKAYSQLISERNDLTAKIIQQGLSDEDRKNYQLKRGALNKAILDFISDIAPFPKDTVLIDNEGKRLEVKEVILKNKDLDSEELIFEYNLAPDSDSEYILRSYDLQGRRLRQEASGWEELQRLSQPAREHLTKKAAATGLDKSAETSFADMHLNKLLLLSDTNTPEGQQFLRFETDRGTFLVIRKKDKIETIALQAMHLKTEIYIDLSSKEYFNALHDHLETMLAAKKYHYDQRMTGSLYVPFNNSHQWASLTDIIGSSIFLEYQIEQQHMAAKNLGITGVYYFKPSEGDFGAIALSEFPQVLASAGYLDYVDTALEELSDEEPGKARYDDKFHKVAAMVRELSHEVLHAVFFHGLTQTQKDKIIQWLKSNHGDFMKEVIAEKYYRDSIPHMSETEALELMATETLSMLYDSLISPKFNDKGQAFIRLGYVIVAQDINELIAKDLLPPAFAPHGYAPDQPIDIAYFKALLPAMITEGLENDARIIASLAEPSNNNLKDKLHAELLQIISDAITKTASLSAIKETNKPAVTERLLQGQSPLRAAFGVATGSEFWESVLPWKVPGFINGHAEEDQGGPKFLVGATAAGALTGGAIAAVLAAGLPVLAVAAAGALFGAATVNIATHTIIDWNYINESGLKDAVDVTRTFSQNNDGEIHVQIEVLDKTPEDPEEWDRLNKEWRLENTGLIVNERPVWASTSRGVLAVFAENADPDEVAAAFNQGLFSHGVWKGNGRLTDRFKKLLKETADNSDLTGINVAYNPLKTVFAPGIIIDETGESDTVKYTKDGAMKVSRKALTEFMLNAAQDTISTVVGRLSRIRRADAGAVTESIGFLDESTTLKEFLENLYQFTAAGNGQLIVQPSVFGEANATKVRELTALAKRSGVRLYIDLSGSDAGIEQYRDHGFAGYLKKDALFNFLSVPKNAESVTAGIVEVPANVEAREFPDALKKALRSSEKEFKIIRLAQVADYLRQERSTEGRMAITDILRMPVLSIFAPEQINETYVQRVAYNWPREKLPLSDTAIEPDIDAEVLQKMIEADPDVQTYLLKLKKDIRGTKQENNYAALSGIFIETMTERRLAQAALSKDMNGAPLADEDMERALGYLLKIRNRDTKAVFDQNLIDDMTNDDRKSTEEVLAAITSYVAQVRQKKVRTDEEIATAIELLVAYAERKHAETIKKKEQGFDANSVKAILKAA